jgi:chromosome segregation ATPase
MLDSHARKSRFTTLSSEVDSALWVLYRELESATSLRQRITELEAEVVKLRQDVNIRDNQIILSQRSAQATAPVSQAELEQLRTKAAKWHACAPELGQLRAKNEALEQSLRDARAECASKDEVLNEWKGRLASLIGP